ncbi:hypothetical protein D6825_01220 [Candidatus Woesearchaeota archaeon]|nr:MAG: hypothetical protein D6825_01220 [Candidatus Woesearchaeota archaeon]
MPNKNSMGLGLKCSQKGQIKMFETVGVLVVFFLLLGVSAVFYFYAQESSLRKTARAGQQQLAFDTWQKALHFPELDCSFLLSQKETCIDILKAQAFSSLMQLNASAFQFYFTEFGDSRISVEQVYPQEIGKEWVLYDSGTGKGEQIASRSPILLYDALEDEYAFGVIEVLRYV